MTVNENAPADAQAICTFCGGEFPQARADLGYGYCMKAPCREQGFKVKPIEVETVPTENRF